MTACPTLPPQVALEMEEERPTASAPSSARGFALKHTMRRVMQVGHHRVLHLIAPRTAEAH